MADLIIETKRIIKNIEKLDTYLKKNGVSWSLITKVLSGNKEVLKAIINANYDKSNIQSIGDSRLSSLKIIKSINPEIKTMYIKPPAIKYADSVVKYADVSLNSSERTILALNDAAKKHGVIHEVIVMIELGELREGILRKDLLEFYDSIFRLSNINVVGIGTNLGCMYGIEPTYDKLVQLALYKQLIEAKFDKKINLVSGGSSITLPLIGKKKIPKELNHFRIGEAAFLGKTPLTGKKYRNLSITAFEFDANLLEVYEKEVIPDGVIGEGNIGETKEIDEDKYSKSSHRGILDFGVLDVDVQTLHPKDKEVKFAGTTSDMTVYDLGDNTKNGNTKYRVGNKIRFIPDYMAVARLMVSKFTDIIVK
jgi:predicted amino acid racemase